MNCVYGSILIIITVVSCCCLGTTIKSKDAFPTRSNILFVVGVNNEKDPKFVEFLTQLLDGISLMKYRISWTSTTGFEQDVFEYKSRKCLLDGMKNQKMNSEYELGEVLEESGDEFFFKFNTQKKIIVVITSDSLEENIIDILSRLKRRKTAEAVYSIVYYERKGENSSVDVTRLSRNPNQSKITKNIWKWDDVFKELSFYQKDLQTCKPLNDKKPVFDECQRECQCIKGKLANCYRVRKHFSSLSLKDRLYYIEAYKELATGLDFKESYHNYMKIHTKNFKKLHTKSQLLTWHRRFIYEAENNLRLLDCRITLPFWNFPLYENTTFESTSDHHFWDTNGGFGRAQTDINKGYCVETGDFRQDAWKIPKIPNWSLDEFKESVCNNRFQDHENDDSTDADRCMKIFENTYRSKCVTRNPGCFFKMPTYKGIYDVIKRYSYTNYTAFELIFRDTWHNNLHDCIGGHMGTDFSPYAPEFWPFHSMIDALWTYWQNKGPKYKEILMHDRKTKIAGFNELRAIYQDNDNLGGCGVKIKYTEIFPFIP